MNKVERPEINTSELTSEVRKAIKRQVVKGAGSPTNASDHGPFKSSVQQTNENHSTLATALSTNEYSASAETRLPNLELQPAFKPNETNEYHLNTLLGFHDAEFVKAAYSSVLKREPDSVGYNHYLKQLREGHLDKVDIVASLRFSPEGRRQNVRIQGLALPNFIRRLRNLPVVGYPIRLGIDILRLPVLLQRIRAHEAHSLARDQKIVDHINHLSYSLTHHLSKLSASLAEESRGLAERQEQLSQKTEALQGYLAELKRDSSNQLDEVQRLILEQQTLVESSTQLLRAKISEIESLTTATHTDLDRRLQQARADLALQARQTGLILSEARRRLPQPFDEPQLKTIAAQESHQLDALYAELEDHFRGSRDEIRDRFRIYLEHIKSVVLEDDFPIVDLGCGRGEWLELLKDGEMKAVGVDTNVVFLERCRERNLEVVESEAVQYLSGLPDNSLGAITGFHIVEHLPIEILINLLDEIVRVLRPGGIVILETPNPENILVGSNYFYFDPTHRNPLPSLLLKFLLESRGLHRVEIVNLHSWDGARIGGDSELTARINELFYGPMDYAIMGWKVSG